MARRDRVTIDSLELSRRFGELGIENEEGKSLFAVGLIDGLRGSGDPGPLYAYEAGRTFGYAAYQAEQRGRRIAAQVGTARFKGGKKQRGEA